MNRNSRTTLIRILLLMAMMIVMMSLCGCRTRITNNDEVSGVMYDEDGYMMDNYQMRRDELGLSTAKKPLFTGLGAPADDDSGDYNDDDAQMLEDYDPSMYEEDLNEPEEVSDGPSSGSGSSSQGSGGRVIRRNTGGGSSSSDSYIEVVLEPNGGTCSEESVKVKKGGKYGKLPAATWEDHEFLGWYTKEKGGTKVGENTKVGATKSHFLYAHWKDSSEESKGYTVTFNTNPPEGEEATLSGNQQITVTEGGNYQGMPSATCTGYSFLGWFTAATDGSKIEEGSKADIKADQTLYAHWDKDPLKYWTAKLNKTVTSITDEDKYTYSANSDHTEFLQDCGMKKGDGSYEYLIFFGKAEDAVKGDKPTIVIPEEATKGTDTEQLIYKYKLINELYEKTGLDTTAAANELDVDLTKLKDIVILPAAEGSGEGSGNGGD